MRGPIRITLLAAATTCAFAALVGQSSAAIARSTTNPAFLAVYGAPSTTGPVGGGLGMNFGFGENVLFEATEGKGEQIPIEITVGKEEATKTIFKAGESFIGGPLTSNKTGKNNPVSFAIQFSDFQKNKISNKGTGGVFAATPAYSDTFDRQWIGEICPPASSTCKTDPLFTGGAGEVHLQDVTLLLAESPATGITLQGDVWGEWINGTATKAPCIKPHLPPTGATLSQTLIVTKSPGAAGGLPSVGESITAINGKACLVSANNDYFVGTTPAVEIVNE